MNEGCNSSVDYLGLVSRRYLLLYQEYLEAPERDNMNIRQLAAFKHHLPSATHWISMAMVTLELGLIKRQENKDSAISSKCT